MVNWKRPAYRCLASTSVRAGDGSVVSVGGTLGMGNQLPGCLAARLSSTSPALGSETQESAGIASPSADCLAIR